MRISQTGLIFGYYLSKFEGHSLQENADLALSLFCKRTIVAKSNKMTADSKLVTAAYKFYHTLTKYECANGNDAHPVIN